MIVDFMRRNSVIRPEQLEAESVVRRISAPDLKLKWLEILSSAERLISQFPARDLGCLYVDQHGNPADIRSTPDFTTLHRHFGTVGGSWPQIVSK